MTARYLFYILFFTLFLGCSENIVKEYYENGNIKSETSYKNGKVLNGLCKHYYPDGGLSKELVYEDGVLKNYKSFYKEGSLNYESEMEGELKNGSSKDFYRNGVLKAKAKYSLGSLINYYEFDSLGAMIYWYETLHVDSLPIFNDDFIKIVNVTDTGFYVQAEVPQISPYQVMPIMARGDGEVVDSSKSLWFIDSKLPKDSLLRIGVRITLNDTTKKVLGWKEVVLSEITPTRPDM